MFLARISRLFVCSLALSTLIVGCGGGKSSSGSGTGGGGGTTTTNNPAPTVTTLSPANALVGAAAQTLTINGTNFISTSTVTFSGASATATYVSATQLTIPLTAANLTTAGEFPVVVTNAAPGGGASTATNFEVDNPAPVVASISPQNIVAGSAPPQVMITGTGFVASSTVTYNGTAHTATYVSGTQLNVTLSASDVATAGEFAVVVTNATPGGGSSAATNFEVDNPAPVVASISPLTVATGATPPAITITGSGFVTSSIVNYNGVAHTATVVSGSQITVTLSAADIAAVGSYPVIVTNPAPGGGSSAAIAFTVTVPGPTLTGSVYRGVSTTGATITAYAVNADGSNASANLGTTTENSNGTFSLALSGFPTGPVRLTATGGTYVSGNDGTTTITATSSLSLLLDSVTANASGLTITPLTEFVNSRATGEMSGLTASAAVRKFARGRVAHTAAPVAEPQAHVDATQLLLKFFGLTSTDVPEMLPVSFAAADVTANPDSFQLGLALGGYVVEGTSIDPTSADDLIGALSSDIEDGVFDGLNNTAPIAFGSGNTITLSPSAGTSDFLQALGTNVSTGTLVAGLEAGGVVPTAIQGLAGKTSNGVYSSSATPASSSLGSGNSGAVSSYSANGKQYLILAARTEGVVVIDVTDPTAATPAVNAWPSISQTVFGGLDVGGVIAFISPSGKPEVLTYAFESPMIVILDMNTLITGTPGTDNPVVSTSTLTLQNGEAEFSGGGAYIAGGIAAGSGVWLDTVDGYEYFDLTTLAISTTAPVYTVDPSEEIAENMGGDISAGVLLAGNYEGLQYIDLAKQQSYYLAGAALTAAFPSLEEGYLFDGNAVDSGYGVGVLNTEGVANASFLNLAAVTETASTGAGVINTLGVNAGGAVQQQIINNGFLELSGSAVDPTTHQVLFMNEFGQYIAVGTLQDPAAVPAGTTWQGLNNWSFYNMGASATLSGFVQAGDPHSVGVIFNPLTSKAYGYILDAGAGYLGVLQIDLAAFQALPAAGTTGDPAHEPATDPTAGTTPSVREITWQ